MKIIIAGGGTAGWIAAYFISKSQPNVHQITVIESSAIGIIGAGEGSTGSLISLLNGDFFNYKIDIIDFIEKTNATPKLGIRHSNWGSKKENYFAPLDASPSGFTLNDYIFKYIFSLYGKEKMHIASKIGIQYAEKNPNNFYALHFDGHKVGEYFKNICLKDGIKVIDSSIKECVLDEKNNIKTLILEDYTKINGDFFIDCTGFSRVLMKKLNVPWISKKEFLPLDTAMPFILDYKSGEEFFPETSATALSAGWMWTIPLSTRKGCGYVFDSLFISKEDAQKEIEDLLNCQIKPIKYINFDSGYSESFFKNNVLCLGLSSSFVEPLEATSIHNTIVQIALFVNECLTSTLDATSTKENKNMYNKRIKFLMDLTVDFISLHYQGKRYDTPFWKHIVDNKIGTPWALQLVERAKNKIPGLTSFEGMYGSFSIPLANWILAGLDLITPSQAKQEILLFNSIDSIKEQYENFYKNTLN